MRLNFNGSIFFTKKEKKFFEENKFNERFGEGSFLHQKNPLMLSIMEIIKYNTFVDVA